MKKHLVYPDTQAGKALSSRSELGLPIYRTPSSSKDRVPRSFPLHFNEGTIEGTDAIHSAIFRDQFAIPEDDARYSERLWLLYGDQKTVKLSTSVQLDREDNESDFERRKWLQPIVSIFHWAQNRLWAIQKSYTGPVNNPVTASLAHNMQYRKIKKCR